MLLANDLIVFCVVSKVGFEVQWYDYVELHITVPLESSDSDLIFMIRAAALAEPDLESYTIRLPA